MSLIHAVARALSDGVLFYGFVPMLLFFGFYLTQARWWETAIGRGQMMLSSSFALVAILVITGGIVGRTSLPYLVARFFIFGYMGTALWVQLILLYRVQRHPEDFPIDTDPASQEAPRDY